MIWQVPEDRREIKNGYCEAGMIIKDMAKAKQKRIIKNMAK